jgi:hypothetical protein
MSLTTSVGKATVEQACALFGVSRAAYYASTKAPRLRVIDGGLSSTSKPATSARPQADVEEIKTAIKVIVDAHPAWGVRKVWATLRRPPYERKIGHRRVWALMKSRACVCRRSAQTDPRTDEVVSSWNNPTAASPPTSRRCTRRTMASSPLSL